VADGAERMEAIVAGDDYELLCAALPGLKLSQPNMARVTPIGRFAPGRGLTLKDRNGPVPLPPRLGFEHDAP
jgi:thiamine-monophosphate kinase